MMKRIIYGSAAALALTTGAPYAWAQEQAKEQFLLQLTCAVGAYANNCGPLAQGQLDYLNYFNLKEGGVNGVKVTFDVCETSYSTEKGVECYERFRSTHSMALLDPVSTGVSFALTDAAIRDKIPMINVGNGVSASQDGGVFKWVFPLTGHYWMAANIQVQHIAKQFGGFDKLKGKKIAAVYFDASAGNEPVVAMRHMAELYGFDLTLLPVTVPGLEQKSTWLQVRQLRPDYVVLWGFGMMNPTALREAAAVGYPREKILGWWQSGAESDVQDIAAAKGYNALTILPIGTDYPLIQDVIKTLYDDSALGAGPRENIGTSFYTAGLIKSLINVETIRRAQEQYGIGKVVTGEQMRWALENLNVTEERLRELGLEGQMRPFRTSCFDHMGAAWARVKTWDGQRWVGSDDWYQMDQEVIGPLVKDAADRYAAERGIQRRDEADCAP